MESGVDSLEYTQDTEKLLESEKGIESLLKNIYKE